MMRKFVFILALFCTTTTHGAENCDAGYYLNDEICTPCTNAPENANYINNDVPNSCAWECKPGYYGSSENGDTSCADCGSVFYCTGGTHRAKCEDTIPSGTPKPSDIHGISNGNWLDYEHATSAAECICNWYFSDETRVYYLNQAQCWKGNKASDDFTEYTYCRTGYYAADPLYWGNWYTSCKPCTNKPEHATYTSYSTPSEMYAVEDNCPWECDDGYGLHNGECVPLCTGGMRYIKTSNGLLFNLYPIVYSTPALHVKRNETVCHAVLAPGGAQNSINIKYNGQTYHTVD